MDSEFGSGFKVLIVDDEPSIQELLTEILIGEGFGVQVAVSIEEAQRYRSDSPFDLVLIDKNLPDGNGLQLAEEILMDTQDCQIIVITAYASLENAIDAMRMGITDYLIKPFDDLDAVRSQLKRATESLTSRRNHATLLSELKTKNEMLEQMATRDALTGLFNHAYFQERLGNELSRSSRYRHQLGLLFLDVDNFKEINDSQGHQVGDSVLKTIAEILRGKSRTIDFHFRLREHDIAARYGGDEFVVVLPETPKSGTATTAERLRACVEQNDFGVGIPNVTVSVGVAAYPNDGQDRTTLIGAADAALYAAKNSGRNRVVSYSPDLGSQDKPNAWEAGIDVARLAGLFESIRSRSFQFVYQPIVEAKSGKIMGYEALCRPQNEKFKSPNEVLTTAERSGKVTELGRLLREMAVSHMQDLPDTSSLFVNLHPQELNDPALVAVEPFLKPYVKRLVLEVNDSRNISDQRRLREVLLKLRDQGFRIALDDLCTGYMGLNSMARLQPDYIKLNTSLLDGIDTRREASLLMKHLLEYTASTGIQVIAFGIETEEERNLALRFGCPLLQGFLFGKAEPSSSDQDP